MGPGDRIELRGLRVDGHHGATADEQAEAQPFELDLTLVADLAEARASDRLADTVDYGAVSAAAAAVVAGERHRLMERLAQRVAEEVASLDARLECVEVVVRKLRPPVPEALSTAGVRARYRRPPSGPRRRAFVGLGANLGDRWATLRDAVAALPDVVGVSPVYETAPVGGPPGQPPYLNLVVELWTRRSARQLLGLGRRLEDQAGRVREEVGGPRTLDVDLLVVGDERHDTPELTVPHPRMHVRRFVLAPLADLAPDAVPAGWERVAAGEVRRLGPLGAPHPAARPGE